MTVRRGESRPFPFRSERVFYAGGEWYYTTREGSDRGPYNSREEAEAELLLFLREFATEDERIMADLPT